MFLMKTAAKQARHTSKHKLKKNKLTPLSEKFDLYEKHNPWISYLIQNEDKNF